MDRRSQPERRLESSYPFIHELHSQFRDMDPLAHVNNVVVAAYYEDARVHFLSKRWGGPRLPDGPYLLVANVDIDYLGIAHHPRAFRIGVGVSRIGTASLTISTALFQEGICIGLADTTLVQMLGTSPASISDERHTSLEDAMVGFALPVG